MIEEKSVQRASSTNSETASRSLTFDLAFAAAGCNQSPGCLAALTSREILAYGANGNVLVVVDSGRRVSAALPFFQKPVTSLVFSESEIKVFIVAASSDGNIAVWSSPILGTTGGEKGWSNWNREYIWKAHVGSVVTVDAFWSRRLSKLVIVSAGLDSKLRIWAVNVETQGDFECVSECCLLEQSGFVNSLPECVAVCSDVNAEEDVNNEQSLLIAVGGTHKYLQFFAADKGLENLRHVGSISGHRDWIQGVAFSPRTFSSTGSGTRYIATASKDSTARIWSLKRKENSSQSEIDPFSDLGPPRLSFSLGEDAWEVAAVTLLKEHENAVHSVCFQDPSEHGNSDDIRLVTASMDCSIAIWQASNNGTWMCMARFGLLGGVGAHALGFFGAAFVSRRNGDVVGHNFGGGIHCWRAKRLEKDESNLLYIADCAPSGHFGPVNDLDWDSNGKFFLTCSQDKTTRIFLETQIESVNSYAEWARPQTHGHAVQTLAIGDSLGTKYFSGSEESMLRMFDAPFVFLQCGALSDRSYSDTQGKASTAIVPELGLSNKAVYSSEPLPSALPSASDLDKANSCEVVSFGAERSRTDFPLEEELKQNTLWPETGKLYGHGNTISCVAVSIEQGTLLSACYAQKARDACIRVWDIGSGLEIQQLPAHDLTVTRLCFSKDGSAVLSVSRDRSFAIHSISSSEDGKSRFLFLHRRVGAHTRQIFDGTWIFDRDFIVTCGRDKRLRFFSTKKLFEPRNDGDESDHNCREILCLKYDVGISAVSSRISLENKTACAIAVGFEDGTIRIFWASPIDNGLNLNVEEVSVVPDYLRCSARITRLHWRPIIGSSDSDTEMQLGVASEDHSARVLSIR